MKLLHSRENPNKWELWRITDPRGVRWRISPRFEHVVDETPGQIKRGCRKVLQEGNLVVVTGVQGNFLHTVNDLYLPIQTPDNEIVVEKVPRSFRSWTNRYAYTRLGLRYEYDEYLLVDAEENKLAVLEWI